MFLLAWKNVLRRRGQSAITFAITVVTVMSFVLAFSVFFTLQSGLQMCSSRLGADVIVLPNKTNADAFQTIFTAQPVNVYMPEEVLDQVAVIPGVEKVTPQFFTQTLDQSCCSIGGVSRLVGIDTDSDFILEPWLTSGTSYTMGPNEILVGSNAPVFLGNQAAILGEVFKVVGSLEPMGSGTDETIFMNLDSARRLAANSPYLKNLWLNTDPMKVVSAALIKVQAGANPEEVANSINDMGIKAVAVATGNLVSDMRGQMAAFGNIVFGLWLALFVIAAIALIGRFSALARERKKEIGLLRALGAQKKEVFSLIVYEAWLIAGTGGIVGSLLGIVGVTPLIDMIREAISLPAGQWGAPQAIISCLFGILLAMLMGFIAAVYPAIKSASLDPQEAMTKGELD